MIFNHFKRFLSLLLSFCLLQLPPGISSAAKAYQDVIPSNEEMTEEVFDILRPVRKHETVSEIFYRAIPRLSKLEQTFISQKLENKGHLRVPDISMRGKEIVIAHEGLEGRIGLQGEGKNFKLTFNGVVINDDEGLSPKKRFQRMEKILKGQKTGGPLISWLLPKAHAIDMMMILSLGVLAGGLYFAYKKNKEAQEAAEEAAEAAAAGPTCSSMTPSCCVVNGCYQMHENACCQEISGAGFGVGAACPQQVAGAVTSCKNSTNNGRRWWKRNNRGNAEDASPSAVPSAVRKAK